MPAGPQAQTSRYEPDSHKPPVAARTVSDERLYRTMTSRNASMIKQGTYSPKCDEVFSFISPQTSCLISRRFLECCGEEGWNEAGGEKYAWSGGRGGGRFRLMV